MVTVQQLLEFDFNSMHAAAEDWGWISWRLGQIGQEIDDSIARPIKAENRWSGDDARAAGATLDGINRDVQAVAKEAGAVGKFLDDVTTGTGDGFGDIKEHTASRRFSGLETRSAPRTGTATPAEETWKPPGSKQS